MADIKDLYNRRYPVKTTQLALYNDDIFNQIGAPLSTENDVVTDKYDETVIGAKVTLKKILEIYHNGLYLSIVPRANIIILASDIEKILDEYYSNTSFNTRSQLASIVELDVDVKDLKKFYSAILTRNGKIVEYAYNKPSKSGFDLNIDDEMFSKKVLGKQVSHNEIIKRSLESSSSLMGTGSNYRVKGFRRDNENR